MTVSLGFTPSRLNVVLTAGADFVSAIDNEGGNWDVGVAITLTFNDSATTSWPATITGPAAEWNVDKVDVDALISRLPRNARCQITYVDGPLDLVFFTGEVRIHRAFQ